MIQIPWAKPYIDDAEISAVVALLKARRISMGQEVIAFEHEVAEFVGRKHGIAVANGSVALDLALKLAGVGSGDEVLVSSLSYVATTNSIFWQGAKPIFCDIDPATLNIDPTDLAERAAANGNAKAVLVADYCGSSVDYDQIVAICNNHDLILMVDGAQSLGTVYRGKPACSMGTVATTSFHTAKAMLCGEGGMVFTDVDDLADWARRMRGQGEIPGRKYVHDILAWNYRMTDIAAAIGRVQLSRADQIAERRSGIAEAYTKAFKNVDAVTPVEHLPNTVPAWFSFAILVANRDDVAARLNAKGIETRSLYPVPAYRQPIEEYGPFVNQKRPNAEAASAAVLNLPVFFEMTENEVQQVVVAVEEAVG